MARLERVDALGQDGPAGAAHLLRQLALQLAEIALQCLDFRSLGLIVILLSLQLPLQISHHLLVHQKIILLVYQHPLQFLFLFYPLFVEVTYRGRLSLFVTWILPIHKLFHTENSWAC